MTQAIEAYREVTVSLEFKELERLRSLARNNEASALSHAERKGRLEGKLETALAMLADGLPLETASKYSGIPEDELKVYFLREFFVFLRFRLKLLCLLFLPATSAILSTVLFAFAKRILLYLTILRISHTRQAFWPISCMPNPYICSMSDYLLTKGFRSTILMFKNSGALYTNCYRLSPRLRCLDLRENLTSCASPLFFG